MRIRRWLMAWLGLWWHWQNLNDDRSGRVKGSGWWAGCCFLHRCRGRGDNAPCTTLASLEWYFGPRSHRTHIGLHLWGGDNGREIMVFAGVRWLFNIYLSLENMLRPRWHFGEERDISLRIFDWAIWWTIWRDPMVGFSHDWRDRCFHISDFFLGRSRYRSREILNTTVGLTLLEGTYPIAVRLTEDSWTRPRWPRPEVVRRAHMDIEGGIPIPGKGECEYDCGEDAIFEMTCQARSVGEAISVLARDVLSTRLRYGGRDWEPESVRA